MNIGKIVHDILKYSKEVKSLSNEDLYIITLQTRAIACVDGDKDFYAYTHKKEIKEQLTNSDYIKRFANPFSFIATCEALINYQKRNRQTVDKKVYEQITKLENAVLSSDDAKKSLETYKKVLELITDSKESHVKRNLLDLIKFVTLTYNLYEDKEVYLNMLKSLSYKVEEKISDIIIEIEPYYNGTIAQKNKTRWQAKHSIDYTLAYCDLAKEKIGDFVFAIEHK